MKEPCRKMPVLFNETPVGFFEGFGIMKTDGSLTRIFFPIPGTGGSWIPVPPLKYPEPGGALTLTLFFQTPGLAGSVVVLMVQVP